MDEVKLSGKQRRKRSPRAKTTKRKSPDTSARLKELWKDPEFRENMRVKMAPHFEYRKAHPELFSRRGVPDGMRKPEADALWAVARDKAKKAIQIMKDEGNLPEIVIPGSDDEKATVVLEQMMTIVLSPLTHQPTKIAAGRTVLEWCRSKPVQKTAVAISNAEDWLNSVVSDNKATDDQPRRLEGDTPPST